MSAASPWSAVADRPRAEPGRSRPAAGEAQRGRLARRRPSAMSFWYPCRLERRQVNSRMGTRVDTVINPLTASPAVSAANHDDESRVLLDFLQLQRDSVLRIVEGLPEDAW